jgi:enoyl-CoA hydratase
MSSAAFLPLLRQFSRSLATASPLSLRKQPAGSITLAQVAGAARTDGLLLARAEGYSAMKVAVDDDGVATITLNRPKQHNAFNVPLWGDLLDAFSSASDDPSVRVCVLKGAGGNFSSGMDLSVFAEMQGTMDEETCDGRKRERLLHLIEFFQTAISAPERCSKPVICALEGNAIGGGVDLATACDMRYTTSSAKISVKEVDLGIIADVGTMQRLPHLVGDQRARELTYTGRTFSGDDAARYGLALEAFADADALMEHVYAVAGQIAAKSPLTVRGIKRVALYTRDHPTDQALGHVAQYNAAVLFSEDLAEAGKAMKERRTPIFRPD